MAAEGKTAYLACRVFDRDNKTVSHGMGKRPGSWWPFCCFLYRRFSSCKWIQDSAFLISFFFYRYMKTLVLLTEITYMDMTRYRWILLPKQHHSGYKLLLRTYIGVQRSKNNDSRKISSSLLRTSISPIFSACSRAKRHQNQQLLSPQSISDISE